MSNKAPSISTPQGGGALNGLGEKFSPDLFTGTGNFSVPIVLPPGRNGFQPELTLGYSTGNGNSAFGSGWNLSVPGVTRKTSKGIPGYDDETDVFILSGAEDLVLVKDEQIDEGGVGHRKRYYRPRTEGLFARIIHHTKGNEDYWEVNSKDGLISYYGTPGVTTDDGCVIANPHSRNQIFAWRLYKTIDPFGNKIVYTYARDLMTYGIHQYDQLYLSKINYVDYIDGEDEAFLAEVVFNYQSRPDPFSEYKQGFEIRTTKRCDTIQIFTNAESRILTKTYDFIYLDEQVEAQLLPLNGMSMLTSIQVIGHNVNDIEKMPPLTFNYSKFTPQQRDFYPVKGDDLPNVSLADPSIELVDLTGNGLPDIIQMDGNVRWWRNKGNGEFDRPKFMTDAPAGLFLADPDVQMIDANGDGRADLLVNKPGLAGYFSTRFGGTWDKSSFQKYRYAPSFSLEDPEVKLVDMNGDGVTDILRNGARMEIFLNNPELGFYKTIGVVKKELSEFPNVSFSDSRVRLADMCGSGMQDVVLIHGRSVEYWPNMGYGKWGKKITMLNAPELPFRYNPSRLLLGDVDGDGLADLMYIDNGRVLLWINQCGNSWSDMVEIKGTPQTDDMDAVRLTDLQATGVSGILWSGIPQPNKRAAMFFLDFTAGNKPYLLQEMDNHMGSITRVQYTSSIKYYLQDEKSPVTRWKTELPFPVMVVSKVEVIDGISLGKLATEYSYHHGYWDGQEREFRGFGRVDQRDTESFTRYNDTQVVSNGLEANTRLGSFLPVTEEFYSPPTETRTWFHQGPMGDPFRGWYEADYTEQYWQGDLPYLTRDFETVNLLKSLPPLARRDALRTLRGTVLRTELYALDNTPAQGRPYTVTEAISGVRTEYIPPSTGADSEAQALYAFNYSSGYIFFPFGVSQRSSQWERGNEPLSTFSFTNEYDEFGQPQVAISIAVPRYKNFRISETSLTIKYLATRSTTEFIYKGSLDSDEELLITTRTQKSRTWDYSNEANESVLAFYELVLNEDESLDVDLIAEGLNYYDGAAYTGLALGSIGDYGALTKSEILIVNKAVIDRCYFGARPFLFFEDPSPYWNSDYPTAFRDQFVDMMGYVYRYDAVNNEHLYYTYTSRNKYDFQEDTPASEKGLIVASKDPFDALSTIEYDEYLYLPQSAKQYVSPPEDDNIYLETLALYDYRVLQPYKVTDPNGNITVFDFSELGLLRATALIGKGTQGDYKTSSGTFYQKYAPSTLLEYDFFSYYNSGSPVWVKTTKREYHFQQDSSPDKTIISVQYSDGFGRLLQTRTQAEDTIYYTEYENKLWGDSGLPADQEDANQEAIGHTRDSEAPLNVVVSGWQIYNNKGKVVEKYEPFFDSGFEYSRKELFIFGPLSVCEDTEATFFTYETAGSTYKWSVDGADIISGEDTHQITIEWTATGSKIIKLIENNPYQGTLTAQQVVEVVVKPAPNITSTSNITCVGEHMVFDANYYNADYNYDWTITGDGTEIIEQDGDTITLSWSEIGAKTINVSINNGSCKVTQSVPFTIEVRPVPEPDISASESTACTDQVVVFSANFYAGYCTYNWQTDGAIVVAQTADTITLKWATPGSKTIEVEVANGGCIIESPPFFFDVVAAPAPYISAPSSSVCEALEITLSANDNPIFTYNWSLDVDATVVSQTDDTITVYWTSTGSKTITVEVDNGACIVNSSPFNMNVMVPPAPSISGPTPVCTGANVLYSANNYNPSYTYTWSLDGGTLVSQSNDNVTVNWTTAGIKDVSVLVDNGVCAIPSSSFPVDVLDVPSPTVTGDTAPATFTPEDYTVVTPVPGNTYTWSCSSAGIITGGQGTDTVTIEWQSTGSEWVEVYEDNGSCGTTSSKLYVFPV